MCITRNELEKKIEELRSLKALKEETEKEYTEEIEPIYMACDLPTKEDFIKAFNETFERIVYPIVENTISNFSTEEKLAYLYSFRREEMDESVRMFDRKARQIAYDYMKLYLMVVV